MGGNKKQITILMGSIRINYIFRGLREEYYYNYVKAMKYLYLLVKGQLDPSKKQDQIVAHVPELIIKNNVANLSLYEL